MRVMGSGSHFLREPETWRWSLVDREDRLAVRREREAPEVTEGRGEVLPRDIKGQAAPPRLSLH